MAEVPDVRVSDAEREQVADRLRDAAGEGRLDPHELDERLGRAYAARTRAELSPLTADLPPAPVAAPGPAPLSAERRPLANKLVGLAIPNVICIAVWAATGAGSFWPIWVLLGTGIAALSIVVGHLKGEPGDDDRPGPGGG